MVSTHLKNISPNGNLPQIGMNIKKKLKPPPRHVMSCGKILGEETMGSFSSLAKNSSKPMGGGVLTKRRFSAAAHLVLLAGDENRKAEKTRHPVVFSHYHSQKVIGSVGICTWNSKQSVLNGWKW